MLLGGFFVFVFNHAFPQIAGQSMPIAQFIGSAVLLVATTAGVVSWIKKGEIRVDLSSTQLRLRGQIGPFVVLRFLDVSEIWKVMLTTNPEKEDLVRDPTMKWQRKHIGLWKNALSCVVCAEKKNVQLTFGHGPETARQIAGLVRGRLRSMGNQL